MHRPVTSSITVAKQLHSSTHYLNLRSTCMITWQAGLLLALPGTYFTLGDAKSYCIVNADALASYTSLALCQ
jgi:hypothetical protein